MPKNQKTLPLQDKTPTSLAELQQKRELLAREARFRSKVLTEEIVELWDAILKDYSVSECEYAFEHWIRNGHFFIKPPDFTDIVAMYRNTNRLLQKPKRFENHGEGYGEADVQWLMKSVPLKMAEVCRPLISEDVDELLDELDRKRA
jgi:hypothetical protein